MNFDTFAPIALVFVVVVGAIVGFNFGRRNLLWWQAALLSCVASLAIGLICVFGAVLVGELINGRVERDGVAWVLFNCLAGAIYIHVLILFVPTVLFCLLGLWASRVIRKMGDKRVEAQVVQAEAIEERHRHA